MDLEKDLGNDMMALYKAAKTKCNYNATRFFQMFREHGALQTAKILISSTTPTAGFTAMWECKCLDITIEKLVLNEKYKELFSEEELAKAKKRLIDYGYKFD